MKPPQIQYVYLMQFNSSRDAMKNVWHDPSEINGLNTLFFGGNQRRSRKKIIADKILRKLTFCPSNFYGQQTWKIQYMKMWSMQRDHHKLHLPKLQKKIFSSRWCFRIKERRVFYLFIYLSTCCTPCTNIDVSSFRFSYFTSFANARVCVWV